MSTLDPYFRTLTSLEPMRLTGRVAALRGLTVLVRDLPLPVGTLVDLEPAAASAARPMLLTQGEVVGFDGEHAIVMTLGSTIGIRPGDRAVGRHAAKTVGAGESLLGRVINAMGTPIDGGPPLRDTTPARLNPEPLSPLDRARIVEPIYTGVRAIDLFATLGRGQRMGIFAGPGVGKSTLLGSIARQAESDVNVVALVGERGREVREFIESSLGEAGLARSVVVAATSDESPLMRVRAAEAASAIAEHFRDRGMAVMLMMDSVTRFAHAQRQIGLSVGEPPATRGYTPSVFAALARLLERPGAMTNRGGRPGSITALYTILVEGDDLTEPVADAARGILDGHVILARKLAQRAHYPAIDVLDSVSRVADAVASPQLVAARRQLLRSLAAYAEVEDLVQIGAYARGSSAETDTAIDFQPRIGELLRQDAGDDEPPDKARSRAIKLAIEIGAAMARGPARAPHPANESR